MGGVYIGGKRMLISVYGFSVSEFQGQIDYLSYGLLTRLGRFRTIYGKRVEISPAPGSIKRFDTGSIDHDSGNGIDVMLPDCESLAELAQAQKTAFDAGFEAVGIYPDWRPFMGLHLGFRPSREKNHASWGALKIGGVQKYMSAAEALANRGYYA